MLHALENQDTHLFVCLNIEQDCLFRWLFFKNFYFSAPMEARYVKTDTLTDIINRKAYKIKIKMKSKFTQM